MAGTGTRLHPRPLGNRPVWVRYDPTAAAAKATAPGWLCWPRQPCRVSSARVERHQLRGMEYEEQAKFIKEITTRYNVQHIAIDGTGIGDAVYQLVIVLPAGG